MTIRLSSEYHIKRAPLSATSGCVTGSASATERGIRKRKAAFPELKGFVSLMYFLVKDYPMLVSGSLHTRIRG